METTAATFPGEKIQLNFNRLEDFHPDSLLRLDLFQKLRALRSRLLNPTTFPQAAAELRQRALAPDPGQGASSSAGEDDPQTLARLLGRGPASSPGGQQAPAGTAGHVLSSFIAAVVQPHIVPDPDPQQSQLVSAVDAALGDCMRSLLHDENFQDLEATWSGLNWLLSGLELEAGDQVRLLDVTPSELAADLAGDDLTASTLLGILEEVGPAGPGNHPWTALVHLANYGPGPEDISLLERLGAVAAQAGGPLLAAASPELLGCRSLRATPEEKSWTPLAAAAETRWQELRHSPQAAWIGLVLPRFLLRLPYGRKGEAIDSFPFEELSPGDPHPGLLWGQPALACAGLMARHHLETRQGGQATTVVLELEDLPAWTYEQDGEAILMPCAETLLGERAIHAILDRGLMPLASYPDRNAARLIRLQSIADPPTALPGT
jgi:type VI secretion system protein ImpC